MTEIETLIDNLECIFAKYEIAFDLMSKGWPVTATQQNITASRDAKKLILHLHDELKKQKTKKK